MYNAMIKKVIEKKAPTYLITPEDFAKLKDNAGKPYETDKIKGALQYICRTKKIIVRDKDARGWRLAPGFTPETEVTLETERDAIEDFMQAYLAMSIAFENLQPTLMRARKIDRIKAVLEDL